MDIQSFDAKERHLYGLLVQEVKDILDLLRFKCINKETDCLGFEIPCFIGEAPVIVFMAFTEQRVELSAQWEGRPTKTHYLLRAGFVNLPMLQEGLRVLEAIWKTIIEMPADPEMTDKDWDQEIKDALKGIRILRESRIKMLAEIEKRLQQVHGTPKPHGVEGAIGCGVDERLISEDEMKRQQAEQAAAMQKIEEDAL